MEVSINPSQLADWLRGLGKYGGLNKPLTAGGLAASPRLSMEVSINPSQLADWLRVVGKYGGLNKPLTAGGLAARPR